MIKSFEIFQSLNLESLKGKQTTFRYDDKVTRGPLRWNEYFF